jgi:YgiT-type zinc finger domain-containing protein
MIGRQEKKGSSDMKECYFCKGRVVEQKVKVDFRWGQKLKIIENVPAGVCQQCGEKFFILRSTKPWKNWRRLEGSRGRD